MRIGIFLSLWKVKLLEHAFEKKEEKYLKKKKKFSSIFLFFLFFFTSDIHPVLFLLVLTPNTE